MNVNVALPTRIINHVDDIVGLVADIVSDLVAVADLDIADIVFDVDIVEIVVVVPH